MFVTPKTLLLALALDAALGDPAFVYARIPHPIAVIGRAIAWLERRWNREDQADTARRRAGAIVCLVLVLASAGAGFVIERILLGFRFGWIADSVLVSLFLAQNSLYFHVAAVARALTNEGLARGRKAVAKIVGRDSASLDEAGVCRAALESLAENFSDGVVAPAFWALVFGLPGILVYKTINTADSMIGHMSDRYRAFGWAAARLDDLVNLPASRLTGLAFIAAATLVRGASAKSAWRAYWRDAAKHRSPNAGWPEAAMAGALGLRLGGPRIYSGSLVADSWMGNGSAEATPDDIERALTIYRVAACGALSIIAVLGGLIGWMWR
jgi:adenosylcobinamide-phosphate synthase